MENNGLDLLVVVDMQNDFINGSLGTPEAHEAALATMANCQD